MAERISIRWGDWIAERARYIGLLRNRDVAKKVGCSENQLSRWMQMSRPPARMRKGFDAALSIVLVTTQQILFHDYIAISPENATVNIARDFSLAPWDEKEWEGRPPTDRAMILVSVLSEQDQKMWLEMGARLAVAAKRGQATKLADSFRPVFDALASRSGTQHKNSSKPRGKKHRVTNVDLEKCSNCRETIGALETPHLWNGHVVCGKCRDRLGPTAPPMATPPALATAAAVKAPTWALPAEQWPPPAAAKAPLAYAAPLRSPTTRADLTGPDFICSNPQCGYSGPSIQEAKGSAVIGIVLLLMMVLPGLLYLIFMSGYRYRCPRCQMEVNVA